MSLIAASVDIHRCEGKTSCPFLHDLHSGWDATALKARVEFGVPEKRWTRPRPH
jgi:hypothetical protein